MTKVKAKKHLGQHFLKNEFVAKQIATSLRGKGYDTVVEVGPGMGVLTQFLLPNFKEVHVVEIDRESVEYLHQNLEIPFHRIIEGDFLKLKLDQVFKKPFGLIGNYPYNISSQIIFKALENVALIPEISGMFQKEVAERIVAEPGSKTYGIISVLTEVFYHREYLFTVEPHEFNPPPKVRSGVIRLTRKENYDLPVPWPLFKTVVKVAFNQRRKTLRNSLKSLGLPEEIKEHKLLTLRAEQLSLQDFIFIAQSLHA